MSDPENRKAALVRAVKVAGGQSALAAKITDHLKLPLGRVITQRHVWNWINRQGQTPGGDMTLAVEAVTGESRHELRPDHYPPEAA